MNPYEQSDRKLKVAAIEICDDSDDQQEYKEQKEISKEANISETHFNSVQDEK